MTCHLYENVTIKLLTPEFLFDYENLNPIFFHENKLGGILSLNEHTIESHWEKKILLRTCISGGTWELWLYNGQ